MAKKANNAAPKSAKMNPAMDALNHEMDAQNHEMDTPQTVPNPGEDFRTELVKKAQAAKQAALVGLISQEQADAIWKEAVEACKSMWPGHMFRLFS